VIGTYLQLAITITNERGDALGGMVRVICPEKGGEVPYGPVSQLYLPLLSRPGISTACQAAAGPSGIVVAWLNGRFLFRG
jgi:hypothetical protein